MTGDGLCIRSKISSVANKAECAWDKLVSAVVQNPLILFAHHQPTVISIPS